MTAINCIILEEAAVIVSDTLAQAANGVEFHTTKVMPLPHMRVAVATRGRIDALGKVAAAVTCGAVDLETAKVFLAAAYEEMFRGTEIVVAGWGREGPAAFVISDANTGGKVVDIPHLMATPVVPQAVFDKFASDPINGVPDLLARQARNGSVGGLAVVTQIHKLGIETYVAGEIGAH